MDIEVVDVTLHIREDLNTEGLQEVQHALREIEGVVSTHISGRNPHLLMVAMNPRRTNAAALVNRLLQRGLHGEVRVPHTL